MASENFKGHSKQGAPFQGAAMKKMQEIAQRLYESTPGMQEGNCKTLNAVEFPKNTSKILSNLMEIFLSLS